MPSPTWVVSERRFGALISSLRTQSVAHRIAAQKDGQSVKKHVTRTAKWVLAYAYFHGFPRGVCRWFSERPLASWRHRSLAEKPTFLSKWINDTFRVADYCGREAKAASALNHPNICTIYDIGEESEKTRPSRVKRHGQSARSPAPSDVFPNSSIRPRRRGPHDSADSAQCGKRAVRKSSPNASKGEAPLVGVFGENDKLQIEAFERWRALDEMRRSSENGPPPAATTTSEANPKMRGSSYSRTA